MNWKSAAVVAALEAEDGMSIGAAAAGWASLLRVREAGGPSRSAGSVKMGRGNGRRRRLARAVTAVVIFAQAKLVAHALPDLPKEPAARLAGPRLGEAAAVAAGILARSGIVAVADAAATAAARGKRHGLFESGQGLGAEELDGRRGRGAVVHGALAEAAATLEGGDGGVLESAHLFLVLVFDG